jgi:hypothetical protein
MNASDKRPVVFEVERQEDGFHRVVRFVCDWAFMNAIWSLCA